MIITNQGGFDGVAEQKICCGGRKRGKKRKRGEKVNIFEKEEKRKGLIQTFLS